LWSLSILCCTSYGVSLDICEDRRDHHVHCIILRLMEKLSLFRMTAHGNKPFKHSGRLTIQPILPPSYPLPPPFLPSGQYSNELIKTHCANLCCAVVLVSKTFLRIEMFLSHDGLHSIVANERVSVASASASVRYV